LQPVIAALKHAYVYELPGRGHSDLPEGCGTSVVVSFLRDPTHAPDASCLTKLPQVAFATDLRHAPGLRIVISAAERTRSAFAGEWQADMPMPPGFVMRIELTANGNSLTGSVRRQSVSPDPAPADAISVYDGEVERDQISFKIKSPDGQRTITLSGTLNGDQIAFRRDVEQHGPPVSPFRGLLGTAGPQTFVATRTPK
jgi:hypothetical protein